MAIYKRKAQITQCTYIMPIYITSLPLKKNFGGHGVIKFKKIYTYVHVITFLKVYLSKYKSNIYIMYNFYKLTNHKHMNLTTISGKCVHTDVILSFNMFYF